MYYGTLDTISNRADWQGICVLSDEDTGDPIDISLCRITMTVAKLDRQQNFYLRESHGYDSGVYGYSSGIILTGSTDSGEITLPDVGTFQWLFDNTRVSALGQGDYAVGIRISQDSRVVQLIIGHIKVFEGIDVQ